MGGGRLRPRGDLGDHGSHRERLPRAQHHADTDAPAGRRRVRSPCGGRRLAGDRTRRPGTARHLRGRAPAQHGTQHHQLRLRPARRELRTGLRVLRWTHGRRQRGPRAARRPLPHRDRRWRPADPRPRPAGGAVPDRRHLAQRQMPALRRGGRRFRPGGGRRGTGAAAAGRRPGGRRPRLRRDPRRGDGQRRHRTGRHAPPGGRPAQSPAPGVSRRGPVPGRGGLPGGPRHRHRRRRPRGARGPARTARCGRGPRPPRGGQGGRRALAQLRGRGRTRQVGPGRAAGRDPAAAGVRPRRHRRPRRRTADRRDDPRPVARQ